MPHNIKYLAPANKRYLVIKKTSLDSSFFSEASFHFLTFRKLTGSEMSLCCSIWWSTPSRGTLGDKNEMQSVQPTSPHSRHYHTDESPRSIKGCCLFTKLCTYISSTSFLLSPSLFFPHSCIFLNGCLHCSLSFLLYLHLTGFRRAEVPSRHRSLADIPCPWLIIVEWRPPPAAMPTAISLSGLC